MHLELRILEAIRYYSKHTKFYQASTSEMFGGHEDENFQNEVLTFRPEVHTLSQNYMLIGLQICIARVMVYFVVQEFV